MPDIVSNTRTEKVTKSMLESTPYMMVEPHVAKALCEAQLVFPMTEDKATIYPAFEGVTLEDVRAFILRLRKPEPAAPERPDRRKPFISVEGMAPHGPENHVLQCKADMKIRKRKLVLITETECPLHGVKSNMTVLPDDLATVGLVAIAQASKEERTGEPMSRPPNGGNHNLN
jgi:hypothetical protein